MMSKRRHTAIILLFAFGLASCGTWNHGNFNKRKYTNLKSKTSYGEEKHEEVVVEDSEVYEVEAEEVSQSNHNPFIIEDDFEATETTESNKQESSNQVYKSYRKPTEIDGAEWKERRDYNKLEHEEQVRAVVTFNKIFNVGLSIFLLAILLFILTFIIIFSLSGWSSIWVFFAWVGATLIFIAWIMSMVALNRVRRINANAKGKKFLIKYRLAQVVAYAGVLVCVVTILGGIVLLLLWGARIISF